MQYVVDSDDQDSMITQTLILTANEDDDIAIELDNTEVATTQPNDDVTMEYNDVGGMDIDMEGVSAVSAIASNAIAIASQSYLTGPESSSQGTKTAQGS